MHTHEFQRPLKFSIQPSPSRMFLRELIETFQNGNKMKSSTSSSYCIIGTVKTKPIPYSDYEYFVLDDGTAALEVLCSSPNIIVPDGIPPLKHLELGDEIECFGTVVFLETENESRSESFVFMAKTYSRIDDRNYITWRTLEISLGAYNKDCNSQTEKYPCINIHQDLIKKLQLNRGTATIDRSQIFLFIQQSKDLGGISEHDIAILMGLRSKDERLALQSALEEMQSNFEIYQSKTFSYLPL